MEQTETTQNRFVKYKRNRFTARFASNCFYSKAHYWLEPLGDDNYRVGLTKFAARMLGELVEFGFEIKAGARADTGDILGWMEGFKAASDIYALVDCRFIEENAELIDKPELLHARPHDKGWLYSVNFDESEKEKLLNVSEYSAFLDDLIDKMTGEEN